MYGSRFKRHVHILYYFTYTTETVIDGGPKHWTMTNKSVTLNAVYRYYSCRSTSLLAADSASSNQTHPLEWAPMRIWNKKSHHWKWNKNCQSVKKLQLFIKIIASFTSHHPKTPVPVVSDPIRSEIPWPNIGECLSVPGRGLTNRMIMVRGGPVTISCGFKVEFCVKR